MISNKISTEVESYRKDAIVEINEPKYLDQNKLITLSWENMNIYTPSSKDGLVGKISFCKKEVPGKHIVKNGKIKIYKDGTEWFYLL